MFTRRIRLTVTATLGAVALAAAALAQTAPAVEAGRVEVGVGLSVNALGTDLNAAPACEQGSFPCTHARPSDWGGFGLDLDVARTVARHLAVNGAATISDYSWDSPESVRAGRSSTSVVRALLVGPMVRSSFGRPRGWTNESDRMFGQLLIGVEGSTIAPVHRVVEVGIGVDSHGLLASAPSHTVTVTSGNRLSRSTGRAASGSRTAILHRRGDRTARRDAVARRVIGRPHQDAWLQALRST